MQDSAAKKRRLGRRGEKLTKRYLKKQGYRHIASNYATRQGEIDLIMQDEDTIVFVEVKTRRSEDFAHGEESVNYPKQRHLSAAARHFIHLNKLHDRPCRFDVVAVALPEKGKPVIRHWSNAFTPVQ
jgi:putative endonuclease